MRNVVVSGVLIAVFAVVVGVAVLVTGPSAGSGADGAGVDGSVPVVREDSHVLDDAGERAPVLVEFLDFECEACLAAYPLVEQVRQEYAGELTFVVRYFPIEAHPNSKTAAGASPTALPHPRDTD